MPFRFLSQSALYDAQIGEVTVYGADGDVGVLCIIESDALSDLADGGPLDRDGLLRTFDRNRDLLETLAATRFRNGWIEDDRILRVRTQDVRAHVPFLRSLAC